MAKVKNMIGSGSFWSLDGQRILSSCGNVVFDVTTKKTSLRHSMVSFSVELSPNEQYLAFAQQVHPDGSEFEMIEGEAGECPSPDEIDPDEILIIMENGKVKYKSDFIVYGGNYAWSPDSSFLTVTKQSNEGNFDEMAVVYVPTGEVILFKAKGWIFDWYWSPSVYKIAYQTFDAVAQNDVINVVEFEFKINPFSYSIIKEQTYPLSMDIGSTYDIDYLTWSPDEKRIAFTASRTIWILNLETGEIEPLLPEN
jgi:Tol biopolymer transport system component